jgi:hypothetical protein
MPKQTRKYKTACELADQLGISERDNQEKLYRLLNESGYYWDSGTQAWQQLNQGADPPTELIRVRVWAETSKVEGAAYQLRVAMEEQGYIFLEKSDPYPCRPPKQLESRIYLSFK